MKPHAHIAWPLYLAGLVIIAFPIVDLVATVLPLSPGIVSWRFGAVGMLSRSIMLPAAGLVAILVTAVHLEHVRIQRTVMVLGFVGSALLLLAVAAFTLDVVQLRHQVRAEAAASFKASSVVALFKLLAGAVLLGSVGVAGLRVSRRAAIKARAAGPAATIVRAAHEDEPPPAPPADA